MDAVPLVTIRLRLSVHEFWFARLPLDAWSACSIAALSCACDDTVIVVAMRDSPLHSIMTQKKSGCEEFMTASPIE